MVVIVKNRMPGQSHNYKPEIRFESDDSNSQKGARDERLDQYRVYGSTHGSKQDVIRGDDNEQGGGENKKKEERGWGGGKEKQQGKKKNQKKTPKTPFLGKKKIWGGPVSKLKQNLTVGGI